MAGVTVSREHLIKISDELYEIPRSFRADMRVPARVFVNDAILQAILTDRSLDQLVNVATLPGIQGYAYAMPDIHQGYGFPIGGVAAMNINAGGVISPGGIGYDINCGVRLLVVDMQKKDFMRYAQEVATRIFHKVPSGVGKGGRLRYETHDLDAILHHGARTMVEHGYGNEADLEFCEEKGCMQTADASQVSERAKNRGADQLGTLGSGNHFLEIQYIEEIFDESVAATFGLTKGAITVMIHCGSRGLGHQTCTDYVRLMMNKLPEWGYELPDRELVCAPFSSIEAKNYFAAMAAAANFAWANRHMIAHWVREAFQEVIGDTITVNTVYDVSHNIGKLEEHVVDGERQQLMVHRKGATRAFGPGRAELPLKYQATGQPVLIPGTMGTASYILAGVSESVKTAFGSSCHGAGRIMSRVQAKKEVRGSTLREQLSAHGIIICSTSDPGLAEEAPQAYKDIEQVVDVVHNAHLAHKVARARPIAVVKGD